MKTQPSQISKFFFLKSIKKESRTEETDITDVNKVGQANGQILSALTQTIVPTGCGGGTPASVPPAAEGSSGPTDTLAAPTLLPPSYGVSHETIDSSAGVRD